MRFLPYLINRIIRTEVLNGFTNTIVNQNGFQVRCELSDQHQNLVLFYRSNHLKEVGQKIGLLLHNGVQEKSEDFFITCTSLKTFLTPSRVVQTIGSIVLVSGVNLKDFFMNIYALCQPSISNLMVATWVTKGCIQCTPGGDLTSIKAPNL